MATSRALPILQPQPAFNLDDIRVASPCKASWDDMTGTERVRFCAACQKNVFHLSGMKRSEAIDLIRSTEGKICARFYRRADGTILTADCPVGLALVARRARRAMLGVGAAALSAVAAMLAFIALTPVRRVVETTPIVEAITIKVEQIETEVRNTEPVAGGLAPPTELIMGDVVAPVHGVSDN